MSKLILLLTLMFISINALAEWIQIGEPTEIMNASYADSESIKGKNTNLVSMWVLYDFKTEQKIVGRKFFSARVDKFLSEKLHKEYDCTNRKLQIVQIIDYANNRGTGEVTYNQTFSNTWDKVPPHSYSEIEWNLVCGNN
jgi:hypothetical protein